MKRARAAMARIVQFRWMLVLLCLTAFNCTAAAKKEESWNTIQRIAKEAFAIYELEAKATGTARDKLWKRRTEEFDYLSHALSGFIADNYDDKDRLTPNFAYQVFTYALYRELSGDFWSARQRYAEVCEMLSGPKKTVYSPAPLYNGVTILRLCLRQQKRLGDILATLGPRPTKVSVLYSSTEPGATEFREVIAKSFKRNPENETKARAIQSDALHAYLIAIDSLPRKLSDSKRAQDAIQILAVKRGISFTAKVSGDLTLIGIGLIPSAFDTQTAALIRIDSDYKLFFGDAISTQVPRIFVLRGALASADDNFMTAALNDGSIMSPESPFLVRDLLAVVMPAIPVRDSADIATVDQLLVFASYYVQPLPPLPHWAYFSFLQNQGSGIYSMGNLAALLDGLNKTDKKFTIVPSYSCPRVLEAIRFCAMHAGAFVRFLDARQSYSQPGKSALVSAMARLTKDDVEEDRILKEETGLTTQELEAAFSTYLRADSCCNTPATSKTDLDAMVLSLAQHFKNTAE